MPGVKAAGLISVAGLSSRMGAFKPLLDLSGKPLICRTIESLLRGGVQQVTVVTGRNRDAIARVVQKYPQVRLVYNADYAATAMFDSIKLGLQQMHDMDAVVFLPADVPAVRPETVRVLLQQWEKQKPDVLLPVYQGQPWHPPVISARLLPQLLQYNGTGGLKGALKVLGTSREHMLVPDKGCTMDADYVEDYQRLCQYWPLRDVPDTEVCQILYQLAGTPEPVQQHCEAVAQKAMELGEQLQQNGNALELHLLESAARLHDICRTEPSHAQAGAEFLRQYGFYRIADLVAVHMDWPEERIIQLDEAAVLYLADKLVSGNQNIPLDQRFVEKMKKFADNPEIVTAIKRRYEIAAEILCQMEQEVTKKNEKNNQYNRKYLPGLSAANCCAARGRD